jgi:hypothetical protein
VFASGVGHVCAATPTLQTTRQRVVDKAGGGDTSAQHLHQVLLQRCSTHWFPSQGQGFTTPLRRHRYPQRQAETRCHPLVQGEIELIYSGWFTACDFEATGRGFTLWKFYM